MPQSLPPWYKRLTVREWIIMLGAVLVVGGIIAGAAGMFFGCAGCVGNVNDQTSSVGLVVFFLSFPVVILGIVLFVAAGGPDYTKKK